MEMLNWGQVTPEGGNKEKNQFLYIYNHDISSEEKVDRTIRFVLGRLNYYDRHLPPHPVHVIKIDARGQQVNDSTCDFIVSEIKRRYVSKNQIEVSIRKE